MKAGIEADEVFELGDSKVANVCVAPLKGRDRAVEKAGNMPIGPDKDRTEGPAIAWVHRFDYDASEMHEARKYIAQWALFAVDYGLPQFNDGEARAFL